MASEGAVIIAAALAQPVHRTVEAEQRGDDDVRRDGRAAGFGMVRAIEAGVKLILGRPGEEFHAAEPVDDAGEGEGLAQPCELRGEALGGRFIVQAHVERDRLRITQPAGERRGECLEG